jgi:hypothetical protein
MSNAPTVQPTPLRTAGGDVTESEPSVAVTLTESAWGAFPLRSADDVVIDAELTVTGREEVRRVAVTL